MDDPTPRASIHLPVRPSGEFVNFQAAVFKGRCRQDSAQESIPEAEDVASCPSSVTYGRKISIAVADDCCTEKVVKYAAKYVLKPQDSVELVHICAHNSAAKMLAAADAGEQQKGGSSGARREAQIIETARAYLLHCGKVTRDRLQVAMLPSAKHVGQTLVSHCQQNRVHILVIGSRELTGVGVKLKALVGGEGSVSKYCSEHLPPRTAVVVVKPPQST